MQCLITTCHFARSSVTHQINRGSLTDFASLSGVDSSPFVLVIMCSINDIEMQFREKQNGYASNIMTIKLNSCKQLMLASGGMQ